MVLEQVIKKFQDMPHYLRCGAGKLSKRWKCSKDVIYQARAIVRNKTVKKTYPKILVFDLETSPLKAYVWSRWQQNVYPDQMLSEWFLLTWSAKWLYSADVMSDKLTSKEVLAEDDERIVKTLWKLIDEADIVIAHNGDRFDVPRLNSRFIVNGLPPASSYKTIDTKKVSARQFGFSSNKLSELAKYFGFDGKLDTDFELWAKCMAGDQEALDYMQEYNDQDVILLEEVYLKLRPYIKSHPNVGIYIEKDIPVCSACGSENIKFNNKYYYTHTGKYPIYRCKCGAESRGRKSLLDKPIKQNLLVSIPGR
jgi:DNA polymerase elongation subunit (family B)